jgi:hypothetical protein
MDGVADYIGGALDHAPGINKLVGVEFQWTAHMKPAPTRRRHTRFRPL